MTTHFTKDDLIQVQQCWITLSSKLSKLNGIDSSINEEIKLMNKILIKDVIMDDIDIDPNIKGITTNDFNNLMDEIDNDTKSTDIIKNEDETYQKLSKNVKDIVTKPVRFSYMHYVCV